MLMQLGLQFLDGPVPGVSWPAVYCLASVYADMSDSEPCCDPDATLENTTQIAQLIINDFSRKLAIDGSVVLKEQKDSGTLRGRGSVLLPFSREVKIDPLLFDQAATHKGQERLRNLLDQRCWYIMEENNLVRLWVYPQDYWSEILEFCLARELSCIKTNSVLWKAAPGIISIVMNAASRVLFPFLRQYHPVKTTIALHAVTMITWFAFLWRAEKNSTELAFSLCSKNTRAVFSGKRRSQNAFPAHARFTTTQHLPPDSLLLGVATLNAKRWDLVE